MDLITEKRKAGRPRTTTQATIDQILQLHDTGWGYVTIRTELHAQNILISREQIRYYIRKYRGINPKYIHAFQDETLIGKDT